MIGCEVHAALAAAGQGLRAEMVRARCPATIGRRTNGRTIGRQAGMWTKLRKTFHRAQGYMETDLAGERFRLDPYHTTFWRKAAAGRWEPETLAVLAECLSRDADYLDIGAWIGPTVHMHTGAMFDGEKWNSTVEGYPPASAAGLCAVLVGSDLLGGKARGKSLGCVSAAERCLPAVRRPTS